MYLYSSRAYQTEEGEEQSRFARWLFDEVKGVPIGERRRCPIRHTFAASPGPWPWEP